MFCFSPVLQRISDGLEMAVGLEMVSEPWALSRVTGCGVDHPAEVLQATQPSFNDTRAIFIEPVGQDPLRIAWAEGLTRCALGLEPSAGPDITALFDSHSLRCPAFLDVGWCRLVRLPTSMLVLLIDIPADHYPSMPLSDLLADLHDLNILKHLLLGAGQVADFKWEDDPYAPYLPLLDCTVEDIPSVGLYESMTPDERKRWI
jgi:hypothetical protein